MSPEKIEEDVMKLLDDRGSGIPLPEWIEALELVIASAEIRLEAARTDLENQDEDD